MSTTSLPPTPPAPQPLRKRLAELGRWYLSTWTDPEYRWGAIIGHVVTLAATVAAIALSELR